MGETDHYRAFSDDGTLLYVGISLSAFARIASHRRNSAWYCATARIDIERFPTRKAALIAEADAIRDEAPVFNVQHAQPAPPEDIKVERPADGAKNAPNRLLRTEDVLHLIGVSRSSLYNLLDAGAFPRPSKMGQRINVWPSRQIENWIVAHTEHVTPQ